MSKQTALTLVQLTLTTAREQVTSDAPALSPAWVRHHEDTLRGVERALAVDEMDVPDGTLVAAQKAARMSRYSKRASLTEAVTRYLALAEASAPDLYPVEVGRIARMVGCARATLYNYGLDQLILKAATRQRLRHPRGSMKTEALAVLWASVTAREAQNRALLERLVLVEANAVRLGVDADELYRPMLKPARQVPGKRRRR